VRIQRTFDRAESGEEPPVAVCEAFDAVRAAIDAGTAPVEPGIAGHEADAMARETLTDRGYEGYAHTLGHQVGRHAHDGGTLLGPRWERYGAVRSGRCE